VLKKAFANRRAELLAFEEQALKEMPQVQAR
jgi:hypothetical protein